MPSPNPGLDQVKANKLRRISPVCKVRMSRPQICTIDHLNNFAKDQHSEISVFGISYQKNHPKNANKLIIQF